MSAIQVLSSQNKFFGENAIIGRSIVASPNVGSPNMHADIHDSGFSNDLTNWQGGSGQIHALHAVDVKDFVLENQHLYMLVGKDRAVWIGCANDLIEDCASRAQFRQSSKFADAAYEVAMPTDEGKKVQLIADLLSGHAVSSLHAA